MIWLRTVVTLLTIAAICCAAYGFHLHLHEASREQILATTMLTLFFGILAGGLGLLVTKLGNKE
jgi:hypothetical protein